jgi:hypothetical protein
MTGSGANASALTITLGDDCTPSLELSASFEDRPTRVTATFPRGEATFVNAALELDGALGEASVATAAWDTSDASVAAAELLRRYAPDLWVRSITVDLVTATHPAMWALPNTLRVGQRVTLAGLPSAWFGSTSVDYEILGWTFSLGHTQAFVKIEMRPAGYVPVIGSTDPADLTPRLAEGVSTLTSALTSSGTSVTITSSDPFSTAAGDYPMRVTLDREILSLPSAPGSSTSPQTWTGVTRGVSPTLATSHLAGAAVAVTEGAIVGS